MPDGGLVRGVSWGADGPALSLITDNADTRLPLSAGQWLRCRVESGPGVPARFCLGYSTVQGPVDSQHFACPTKSAAERGFQCGPCFGRDDFRFMHDFHRSGIAPPGLKAYLAQPHWLYIATFADGTTKVGTASDRSKWSRLAEQGALVARYVARARDGSVVRHLEDAVSANLPPTQFVRGAAKFTALLNPRPALHLEQTNQAMADVVRGFVAGLPIDGFETVEEQWERKPFSDAVALPGRRTAYPQPLESGGHGLRLDSLLGGYALVAVDDADTAFLADLFALKGRRIAFGDYSTDVPALQESLF
ncbi:hypothetical protein AL755_19025 [Arthrobacter sp. ERGS1:01]|uniref:hypothetical protein n=1 Tax=Arthrobacter sp. ERGS1:01 TaxID=1704044 RepID=UPI0006CB25C5|nr:hypothetical protein [Arthrobacter sp. ERGS1:01]ALE07074.1 hypothetical protein AL755_19025 [Arthrobacter sp. ERGS1:01]